ncbi:unnamed protein product, partial [Haemonchus placei]|uniref:EF-hand domain-containing protein n=1 Tax=Haemonchus placei TaxID=6290 RepID=A0A0N4WQL3_HAEPC
YESSASSSGTFSRRSTANESSASSSGTFSRRSTATDRYDSVRQRSSNRIVLRMEAEDERVIREKEEKIRRQADAERKQKEEERMKEQALERAKHEAEITRKARVFKHVLEGADKSPELERRLLGVDPETGDRILHEVFFSKIQKFHFE